MTSCWDIVLALVWISQMLARFQRNIIIIMGTFKTKWTCVCLPFLSDGPFNTELWPLIGYEICINVNLRAIQLRSFNKMIYIIWGRFQMNNELACKHDFLFLNIELSIWFLYILLYEQVAYYATKLKPIKYISNNFFLFKTNHYKNNVLCHICHAAWRLLPSMQNKSIGRTIL